MLVPAELVLSLVDRETAVVVEDVGVSSSAILSVDDDVTFDFVSCDSVNPHRVESTGRLCHVHRRRLQLLGGPVADCEAAIVVCDVLVTIVSTLAETFFVGAALVDEDWFEMA